MPSWILTILVIVVLSVIYYKLPYTARRVYWAISVVVLTVCAIVSFVNFVRGGSLVQLLFTGLAALVACIYIRNLRKPRPTIDNQYITITEDDGTEERITYRESLSRLVEAGETIEGFNVDECTFKVKFDDGTTQTIQPSDLKND